MGWKAEKTKSLEKKAEPEPRIKEWLEETCDWTV